MSNDPFETPNQRDPDDFKRKGDQGPPYVKSLTKTRKPQGNKPELLAQAAARDLFVPPKTTVPELRELLGSEPAWELYGRPSSYGRLIEDEWNLHKWRERNTVLGIAMDPQLLTIMQDVGDDLSERQALDRICDRAHDTEHADTMMAADRGTFVHVLTEWADEVLRLDSPNPIKSVPWCDPRFNLTDKHVDLIAHSWRKLIHDNHLTILASEMKVVNDTLRLAGTLDRIVQLEQDLTFDGTTIPAGTIVVLDIKTSTLHADHNGIPSYWAAYPLQIYAYMTSVPYDTATDTRGEWGFEIDGRHALIAHFDIDTLYETGQAVWQLVYVDTSAVHKGVTAIAMAEAYHQTVKFKMAATTSTLGGESCTNTDTTDSYTNHPAPTPTATSGTSGCTTNPDQTPTPPNNASPSPLTTSSPASSDSTDSETRRTDLLTRYQALSIPDKETFRQLNIPKTDLDAIEQAIIKLEVDPFDRVTQPPPSRRPATPDPAPVEDIAIDIDSNSVKMLLADIRNSPQRDTVNRWAAEAVAAGGSIDPRIHPTYRTHLLLFAAWRLAEFYEGSDVRVDSDHDIAPSTVGEWLSKLTIDEAIDLIAVCEPADDTQPEQATLLG